jgi:hypothetical protein
MGVTENGDKRQWNRERYDEMGHLKEILTHSAKKSEGVKKNY